MPSPDLTYELIIKVKTNNEQELMCIKEEIKSWLFQNGVTSFVEGSVDNLFLDSEVGKGFEDFEALGGDQSPISIFRFAEDELTDISDALMKKYGDKISCTLNSLLTKDWTEGWKDGFKPIFTDKFIVLPPWENVEDKDDERHKIIIEPGMAFGTGQHSTTVLCLKAIENMAPQILASSKNKSMVDVGTGTGILAIGASKLGFKTVVGTDIDEDSVTAAIQNAKDNNVDMQVFKGSFPPKSFTPQKFDLVVANILANVLKKLRQEIIDLVDTKGGLILSGLLEEEAEEITSIYMQDTDLQFVHQYSEKGWVALSFENKK